MLGSFIDFRLHAVQEPRNPLDFIQDHERWLGQGGELPAESPGILGIAQEQPLVGQVDDKIRGKSTRKGRLAHLPRAEQEDVLLGLAKARVESPVQHVGHIGRNCPTYKTWFDVPGPDRRLNRPKHTRGSSPELTVPATPKLAGRLAERPGGHSVGYR